MKIYEELEETKVLIARYILIMGASAYYFGNTSSLTIIGVKQS